MKLTLVAVKDEARGTKSFFWKPDQKVDYLPGQYLYYTLPHLNYPDDRGQTRHFTISSSPTEEYLQLTTRIREQSGYKKTLAELPVGSVIEGQGPEGTFIFDPKERGPHIFIAGGIGITPFRSMIKYLIDKNISLPLHLIYSNSDSDFTYKKELDEWIKTNSNLKVNYYDTSVTGHLSKETVSAALKNWGLTTETAVFWLVGPPPFINAIEEVTEDLKVPADRIRSEKFTGY